MKIQEYKEIAHRMIEENRAENDMIEYKKSADFTDRILKTLCAFSNNYMNREAGYLFIGIEEQDDPKTGIKAIPVRPISGLIEGQLEGIENRIKSLFKYVVPRPTCHFIADEMDGKWYLVVVVEPSLKMTEVTERGANAVGLGKGGRYIRVSRESVLPNSRQEYELLRKFAGFSFCDEFHEKATLDDLNYEYMKEYLVRINAAPDIRKLSKEEMAKTLQLVGEDGMNENRIKNFALLMFADRPEDYIPGAHTEIITESKDGTSRMSSIKFDGPIWIQAFKIRNYFKENIEKSFTLREEGAICHRIVRNWPEIAWNELSTNLLLHKNYDNRNYAGIYVYQEHISFINHNRPVPPVSIQDLREKDFFDDRNYLNPQIKEMFYALHLIESYGSGIRRAKNALAENGNEELEFYPDNEIDDYTQVIMRINKEFRKYEASDQITFIGDIQLPKNQKLVYMTILENPGLRIPAISELCGMREKSVENALQQLKSKRMIVYQGSSRGGGYFVNDMD